MDSVLRPRDIQTRIRAGETPEDVAAAAQTSVDRIMGFATPVLAERAYQAELAQKASVRRRAATGQIGHLGQAVTAFLEPHGLSGDDVEWDAWRREDGRWTVLATYLSGAAQQTARFTFDTGGRFVVADNDEARTLVGERTTEPPAPAPAAEAEPDLAELDDADDLADDPADDPADNEVDAPSDFAPVEEPRPADQLALGDDTLGMVLGRDPGEPAPAPEAPTADADWMLTQASDRPAPAPAAKKARPAAAAPAAAAADEPFDEALFAAPSAPEEVETPAAPAASSAPAASEATAPEEPAAKQARPAKGRGRASVPSWDEIMFGTPKDS